MTFAVAGEAEPAPDGVAEQRAANGLSRADWICLALILAWALALRGYQIPREAPWFDELLTLEPLQLAGSLSDYLARVRVSNSPTQPGYFVLAYGWASLFGKGFISLRMLSVLLGLVSIVLAFFIGKRLLGSLCGRLASLAIASAPAHIEFSLEIRMYMLVVVCALASVLTLWMLIERPGRWLLAAHLVVTGALAWSHAFGVFLLPVQAVAWWFFAPQTRGWRVGWFAGQFLASGTLLIWYLRIDPGDVYRAMSWLPAPRLWFPLDALGAASLNSSIVGTWFTWLKPPTYATPDLRPIAIAVELVSMGLAVGALTFAGVKALRKHTAERPVDISRRLLWLGVWWMLPCLSLYVVSHVWRPVYYPRYALYSLVPLFMLVAWPVSRIPNSRARFAGIVAFVLITIWMGLASVPAPARPPWIQALAMMDESAEPVYLYGGNASSILAAKRTITHLEPGYANRLVETTNSQAFDRQFSELAADDAAWTVVVGSGPLPGLNDYLANRKRTFEIRFIEARYPLTVYRIHGSGP